MAHVSTVQVLKVVNEERKRKDGTPYQVRLAVCALLLDDGSVEAAGNLRLSEALSEGLAPGIYRAGFSMSQATYGDNRGDLVSQLVSLTPVPSMGRPATPAAAPAAPKVPA